MNIGFSMSGLTQEFLRAQKKQIILAVALAALSPMVTAQQITSWQSVSIPVAGGGTLSYQVASVNCIPPVGGQFEDYLSDEYRNITYVPPTGASQGASPIWMSPGDAPDGKCTSNYGKSSPVNIQFSGSDILFNYTGESAALQSIVDPKYKVISVLYTMPGNVSSNSFTNTTTNGTVTTIGSNFQQGATNTYGATFLGIGASLNLGDSSTTGNSSAFTETISDAASIGNASNSAGPNTISHSQDMFLLWLNPEVVLVSHSNDAGVNYSVQTQDQEPVDNVEVTAAVLQSSNGSTHVPINLLQRQYDPVTQLYDLPGLANICADQTQNVNNCPAGGQCGCVPADFAGILAQDPLVTTTTATNPLSVDVSGVSACTTPGSTSNCRYVPVPSTKGSSTPLSTLLSGPQCSGCNRPVNGNAVTDTTSVTKTFSQSSTESVGYSLKVGLFSFGNSWSWTDTSSQGSINGKANQIQYSLSSSTVNCDQDVLFYEDTIFHTFVAQQAPGNTSCP